MTSESSMQPVTFEELADLEGKIVEAEKVTDLLRQLRQQDKDPNHYNIWGTIRVNLSVLKTKIERALETIR